MNKNELFDYVRTFYDQDAVTLTDETLSTLTYAVEGTLNRRLLQHPRMRVRLAWQVAAGKDRIPLPDDLVDVVDVKLGQTKLRQYPLGLEEQAAKVGSSFINLGNCLQVFPAPAETTTYLIDAVQKLQPLTTSLSGDNWVSRSHADVYQAGMLSQVGGFLRDSAAQAAWDGKFQQLIEELHLQGWNESYESASIPRASAA